MAAASEVFLSVGRSKRLDRFLWLRAISEAAFLLRADAAEVNDDSHPGELGFPSLEKSKRWPPSIAASWIAARVPVSRPPVTPKATRVAHTLLVEVLTRAWMRGSLISPRICTRAWKLAWIPRQVSTAPAPNAGFANRSPGRGPS